MPSTDEKFVTDHIQCYFVANIRRMQDCRLLVLTKNFLGMYLKFKIRIGIVFFSELKIFVSFDFKFGYVFECLESYVYLIGNTKLKIVTLEYIY